MTNPLRNAAIALPLGAWGFALTAAIAVHAALLWIAVARGSPGAPDGARYAVIAATAIAMTIAFRRWPNHAASIALGGCIALAVATVGPAAVAAVALLLSAATVIGVRVLAWASRQEDRAIAEQGLALAATIGLALGMGTFSATAALPVHRPLVYALVLAVPLLALRRTSQAVLARIAQWNATARWNAEERWWIAVVALVSVVHVFVVAKPEVGYDALAMHLQFPELLAREHRWSHDIGRYVWAVMPLGADHLFAAAYQLAGERAARLANLAFAAIAATLLYGLACRVARRSDALAAIALFASVPLAFVETSSLFVEAIWLALLLAALLGALDRAGNDARATAVLALAAAGALQAKVIAILWLVPLGLGAVAVNVAGGRPLRIDRRIAIVLALSCAIAAWPYANAFLRTGNPVFPFMNGIFRSPLIATTSFNNPLFNAPLRWWTPYDLVLSSRTYLEGRNGSLGFHWLLVYPLAAFALVGSRDRRSIAMLLLAIVFFVAVYREQSYLRYLIPSFALLTVLAAHSLSALPESARIASAIRVAGTALVLLNLHFIGSGGYGNGTVCLRCAFDPSARAEHVFAHAPMRTVAEFLNRTLPEARVAFLVVNGTAPAGFTGYSRSYNWHDTSFFDPIRSTRTGDEVLALLERYRIDHVVLDVGPHRYEPTAIAEFRACCTRPVWRQGDFEIATVQPRSGG